MGKIQLGKSGLAVPPVALGCMRMARLTVAEAAESIKSAMAAGVNFFDHADIYGGGKSEEIFAAAVKELGIKREEVILQSKCGIRKGQFDFSREHVLAAVDGILARLETDYLDILLLHRPDTLFDPREVAATFKELKASGKVRHFGVSNQNPRQMDLLQKYLDADIPLVANQLQFSIMHSGIVDSGFNVNMRNDAGINRDDSVLEYCRLHDITIQAWSPFQYGFFEGVFLNNEKFPELNAVIDELAEKYGVTNNAIAVAWILTHPAQMQVVVGTMNPERIAACAAASDIKLTREEWYRVYLAAGNLLP